MVILVAMITTLEGKGDEFEREFKKLVPKVRSDPGAIAYIVHRSTENSSRFFVYEKYENQEALKHHSSTLHFKEFSRTTASLLAGRPEVSFYREIM